MNAALVAIALGAAAALACAADAAKFTVVDASRAAVIALPARPSRAETLAASELSRYILAMSGRTPQVDRTADPPTGAIVLSAAGAPELGDEGYSICIRESRLHLTGARGRSVLYATYDLLERLGCRWLSPGFDYYGAAHEVVPKKTRLAMQLDSPVVERPTLKYRKLYVEEGLSHNRENLLQMVEWMCKSRFNVLVVPTDYQGTGRVRWDNWRDALIPELRCRDMIIEVGGHGYQSFINADMEQGKLFETHPEWFGVGPDGQRQRDRRMVFCTSSAGAVDYLTRNVVTYLRSHPEIDIFDFWPPDGAKWCQCEECARLGPPHDRQSRLVAYVLSEARKHGAKARFECIAYSSYVHPPASPPMDQSVLIDFCPIGQCFEVQIDDPSSRANSGYASAIAEWKKSFSGDVSIYSYYRKYAWRSLPNVIPHYIQRDLRWYVKTGVAGISSYAEPGDWRTYELNHYVLARLAWDPEADVDAIISDFCISRFGNSAGRACRLYAALEDVVRHACSLPGTSLKKPGELDAFAARLRSARDAFAASAGSDAIPAALIASADYALRDIAIRRSVSAGEPAAQRVTMIEDLSAFIKAHSRDGVIVDHNRSNIERLKETYEPH